MKLRLYGEAQNSIVDGPGLRYVVFVQGCYNNCPGCHNPDSHDPRGGYVVDTDELFLKIMRKMNILKAQDMLAGVTFSGGEPFNQAKACAELARLLHDEKCNIWTYTGYTYEKLNIIRNYEKCVDDLLLYTDVLVDGPFIEDQKSYSLKLKGSYNQRIIALENGKMSEIIG